MSAWTTVHVRVNDAATGQPTPCRVRFATAEGQYLAPLGRLTGVSRFSPDVWGGNLPRDLSGREYAYIDGSFEIRLPVGPITVEIHKGPEYRPINQVIELPPGKMALRFAIDRWSDSRREGWYSGDTTVTCITPHAALLEGAAEDVAVVNLLACPAGAYSYGGEYHPAISNILAFSGQRPALEIPGHIVVVNTLNCHSEYLLGNLALLNCHRVVYPLRFGQPELDNWTLSAWCDQCHRKGGLVIGLPLDDADSGDYLGGEVLADVILGKVDALAILPWIHFDGIPRLVGEDYYDLLSCGFRVPLARGSRKKYVRGIVGDPRTYARLLPDQVFNYKNWIEAVRAGRTFVSQGALLFLSVNEHDPGSVIRLPSGRQRLRVRAKAMTLDPFKQHLYLRSNWGIIAEVELKGTPAEAVLETEAELPDGGWLVAYCWGREENATMTGAHTSPVYVEADGRFPRPPEASVARLQGRLARSLEWVVSEARCETDAQRQTLVDIFTSAQQELRRRTAIV